MRADGKPKRSCGREPVTNVRTLKSPYWRGWLKAEWPCLVPAKIILRMDRNQIPAKANRASARTNLRLWTGERKGETGEYRLLGTESSDAVHLIHASGEKSDQGSLPVVLAIVRARKTSPAGDRQPD
jgi:hypothetical protein